MYSLLDLQAAVEKEVSVNSETSARRTSRARTPAPALRRPGDHAQADDKERVPPLPREVGGGRRARGNAGARTQM